MENAVYTIFDKHREFPEHVKHMQLGPVNVGEDKAENLVRLVRFAVALGWPEPFGNDILPLYRGFLVALVAELKIQMDTATMAQNKIIGLVGTLGFTFMNFILQKGYV